MGFFVVFEMNPRYSGVWVEVLNPVWVKDAVGVYTIFVAVDVCISDFITDLCKKCAEIERSPRAVRLFMGC